MTPRVLRSVCVFCGSRPGVDPSHRGAVENLGRAIAARGLTLVYGGAKVGLMGAIANAALAEGGRVVGVIPKALVSKEVAHDDLTELYLTETMHDRKDRMIALSDAFIALPGGLGTYDEVFETLTLSQLGMHDKANAFLDTNGFFQPLIGLIRHTIAEGFASEGDEKLFVVDSDPVRLLDALAAWQPPPRARKWVERSSVAEGG